MLNIEKINVDLDSLTVARPVTCDLNDVKQFINTQNSFLNIFSQNIRSVSWNMPDFLTLLDRTCLDWDILVLSECWLPLTKFIPPLDTYNFAATTLHKTQNEGVVIYYKKHLSVSIEEPKINDANCLLLRLNPDTCILGLYRPPGLTRDTDSFVDSVDTLLTSLSNYQNIIFCGDINIDILPGSSDKRSHKYLNVLASHGILPGHVYPTHNKTCLDHMMVKQNQTGSYLCCTPNSNY